MRCPSPLDPLGAKGIGELPTVAAPVAVANAIMERKNHNVTRTPQYLRQQKGLKTAPVANAGGLVRFLQWFNDNGADINLRKMSPSTLAAFGLGWYISDTLTRDEKQKWQRQLDDEFKRSIERQDEAKRTQGARRLSQWGNK